MPTKIERNKLQALIKETLGLASSGNDPVVVNEPPVVPVRPQPSVSGAEVGNLKSVPAFESNPTMRKLGRLLSKLTEDQQTTIYKKLRKSVKKIREQSNDEMILVKIIENVVNEMDDEPEWMKDLEGPTAADLEAIDSGDDEAGEYSEEEPDEEAIVQAFQKRAKLTPEELKTVDLFDPELRMGPNALTIGEIIDAIAAQMGVGRSAVTNVLYDFMKKAGDHAQVSKRPSRRSAIPTRLDPEVMGTATEIEKILYLVFQDMTEQLNPDAAQLPVYDRFTNSKELEAPREVFRFFVHQLLSDYYSGGIKSSVDLVSQWHTLGTGREYGNGKPHSENNSLHKFILDDLKELIQAYTPEEYGKMLKKAAQKADKELAKRS